MNETKCIKRAMKHARELIAYRGAQGAPIIHPLSGKPCVGIDWSDEISHAFGLINRRCVRVKLVRGKWYAVSKYASRSDDEAVLFAASEVWAVRIRDLHPIRLF
jgi:hypothetical protein